MGLSPPKDHLEYSPLREKQPRMGRQRERQRYLSVNEFPKPSQFQTIGGTEANVYDPTHSYYPPS